MWQLIPSCNPSWPWVGKHITAVKKVATLPGPCLKHFSFVKLTCSRLIFTTSVQSLRFLTSLHREALPTLTLILLFCSVFVWVSLYCSWLMTSQERKMTSASTWWRRARRFTLVPTSSTMVLSYRKIRERYTMFIVNTTFPLLPFLLCYTNTTRPRSSTTDCDEFYA